MSATLRVLALSVLAIGVGCRRDPPREQSRERPSPADAAEAGADTAEPDEAETGDPLTGEAAHVIPFADRTSMGYLLLLPPGTKDPQAPTRARLRELVEQAFPDRSRAGEIGLLLTMIDTEPHTTDLRFDGELEPPSLDEPTSDADTSEARADDNAPAEPAAEPEGSFDLIGLHIELLHLGIGDNATIPTSALGDPVLTRALDEQQRSSLLGREWALLLRADYRNQHAIRGLRLHQTLVRVAAEHYDALIHDPDTLETMDVETFTERRLRVEAGNVADQIAIVPFPDPRDDSRLRLSTRGMRRFGSVDVELDGLPRDPVALQRASDLIAGLALALAKEAEVDVSGFAVEVPKLLEVDCGLIHQSYSARDYRPPCSGSAILHLVERPSEAHDPRDHVVARIVAPRPESDAPDYDHPQWVQDTLAQLFEVE